MHKSNILLPGIYLTIKICLGCSAQQCSDSGSGFGELWIQWRCCKRKCQKISAERWLIPTQVTSSEYFGFLPVYSWTCGGAGATVILWISWCLNFLLSCLWFISLGRPSVCFTTCPVCAFKKAEMAVYERPSLVDSPGDLAWSQSSVLLPW